MADVTQYITNDPKELVVRGSHKDILWFAILITIPAIGILTDTYENWKHFFSQNLFVAIFAFSLVYGGALFAWMKVFDKRVKLIINRNGIWYSKSQFIVWDTIESFQFVEQKTAKVGTFHVFKLKTKNKRKPYKIDITYFDKEYTQIQTSLNENAVKHSVEDLGLKTS